MKPRQELICWNCDLQYGFPLPKKEQPRFFVECPYCHSEGVVELTEYGNLKDIFRGNDEGDVSNASGGKNLPDLIKTKPIEEED